MPQAAATAAAKPWDDLPDFAPADAETTPDGRPLIEVRPQATSKQVDLPDWSPPVSSDTKTPRRDIGAGEAAVRGAVDTASFGLAPALAGLTEAGRAGKTPEQQEAIQPSGVASEAPGLEMSGEGIGRLLADHFGNHPDPDARAAYERGRQSVADDQKLAQEQHPGAFLAGRFAGAVLTPSFGAAAPGTLGARIATGALAGGIGGAAYGAGSAVGEGEDLEGVGKGGVWGAIIGAPAGGILKGAIGPRAAKPLTAGQKAARTSVELGAPLPRGVTSDSPVVQATTAKLRSVPFAGEKISGRVAATGKAAGERVGDISGEMTGGTTGRAVADTFVRPGLQDVIDNNKASADAAYNAVRSQIDQNARFTMPRTDAMLNRIMADRKAAGWPDPAQGLDQFRNVAGGATFNGAHRARVDAREAGNPLVPHPGYNAADYNRLTRAMTADIRDIVKAAAKGKTRAQQDAAVRTFDQAETQFGRIAEQNKVLHKLVNAAHEGAIGTLLGAAKEKGGDLRLLAQLRHSMAPDDFAQIGGTLLHEIGQQPASGEFSLAKFVTEWGKISEGAKRVLFAPDHLRNIEDIVGMGAHIKGALAKSNTSHTGNMLVIFDTIKTAIEGAIAIGAGAVSPTAGAVTASGFVAANLLTRYLASPGKAASMAAFSRAYGAAANNPTPVRITAFKMATRNMANTLDLDPTKVWRQIEGTIGGKTEAGQSEPGQKSDKK